MHHPDVAMPRVLPAIVGHLATFSEAGFLHIVCEYAAKGDLAHFIAARKGRHFSERTILTLLAQMAMGLDFIHERKVLHRYILMACSYCLVPWRV